MFVFTLSTDIKERLVSAEFVVDSEELDGTL